MIHKITPTRIEAIKRRLDLTSTENWQVSGVLHKGDLKIGKDTRLLYVGADEDYVAAVFFRVEDGRGWGEAQFIANAHQDIPDLIEAFKVVEAERDKVAAEFKNFHRLLCERFKGHAHDEVNWKRDQVSLIEHIAKRITDLESAIDDISSIWPETAFGVVVAKPSQRVWEVWNRAHSIRNNKERTNV